MSFKNLPTPFSSIDIYIDNTKIKIKVTILSKNLLKVSKTPPAKSDSDEIIKVVKSSIDIVWGISGNMFLAVLYNPFCIGFSKSEVLTVSGKEFNAVRDSFNNGGNAKNIKDTKMTTNNIYEVKTETPLFIPRFLKKSIIGSIKEATITATSIDTISDFNCIRARKANIPIVILKISLAVIFITVLYVFLWGDAMVV
jgi:hypothetical protein